jgi:hypothetical protein
LPCVFLLMFFHGPCCHGLSWRVGHGTVWSWQKKILDGRSYRRVAQQPWFVECRACWRRPAMVEVATLILAW